MTYTFHPGAGLELLDAFDYYEECCAGLGAEFTQEVHSSIQRIPQLSKGMDTVVRKYQKVLAQSFSIRCYLSNP
jgi:hypothetical protein